MKKKTLTGAICLLLGLALIFGGIYAVMDYRYADSILPMKRFYQQKPNTVDVLGLGTSHIYEGLSPAVLYRDYGIAAYDLCAPAQAVWNSYYYFAEALKTQTPKAVVFDVYMLNTNTDYDTQANAIKTTYGMKWSKNKIAAIRAAFEEDSFFTALLPFYQLHSRYSDMEREDLLPYAGRKVYFGDSFKGFITYDDITEISLPDVTQFTNTRAFNPKHEQYYRAIIELAIEREIPLYVVSVPYAIASDTQATVNTARMIAEEYHSRYVTFLDFNARIADMGIDPKTDFSNKQHLNYSGSVKFTTYFGKLLQADLQLPDRRGDDAYRTWASNADLFDRCYRNFQLKHTEDAAAYLAAVKALDADYTVILTENTQITQNALRDEARAAAGLPLEKPATLSDEEYESLLDFRQAAGAAVFSADFFEQTFDIVKYQTQGGVWMRGQGETDYTPLSSADKNFRKYIKFKFSDTAYLTASEAETDDGVCYHYAVGYNGKTLKAEQNQLSIFIYDNRAQCYVDYVCLTVGDDKVIRP